MSLIDLVGGGYSLYTLACAVFFPLIAALAVFLCLRRAGTVRRILGYFLSMPVYVCVCVFLLCEPQNVLCPLLLKLGIEIFQPEAVGFLLAIGFGVLYLGIVAMICGAGVQKKVGYICSLILTLLFTAVCAAAAIMAHLLVTAVVDTLAPPTITGLFEYFGVSLKCDISLDILSAAAAIIYMIGYFLCFIGAAREDEAKARRPRLAVPDIEPCCAVCEYATLLKDSPNMVLCAKRGVVAEDHICRRFMYDPLKRRPVRVPLPTMAQTETEQDNIR